MKTETDKITPLVRKLKRLISKHERLTEKPFKIIYGSGRFPIRQKRADGTWGCRGCGGVIPKGRTSWCSRACVNRFDPASVIIAVKKRDCEICCICGYDYKKAYMEWRKLCYENGVAYHTRLAEERFPKPKIIEYDHIVPFSEGGLTVLENMRSLCNPCHKERTRKWHRDRAKPQTETPQFPTL